MSSLFSIKLFTRKYNTCDRKEFIIFLLKGMVLDVKKIRGSICG